MRGLMDSVSRFSVGELQNVPYPKLQRQPRVDGDLADLLDFISRQPWGNPVTRLKQVFRGVWETAPRYFARLRNT
jgi:hypothetical protein